MSRGQFGLWILVLLLVAAAAESSSDTCSATVPAALVQSIQSAVTTYAALSLLRFKLTFLCAAIRCWSTLTRSKVKSVLLSFPASRILALWLPDSPGTHLVLYF